ncbi:MAG: hypothetical protein Q4G67_00125 [Actinomycetia bacterium]|nr:hypothetical protein [Actinomycetes bacterium]
MTTNSSNAPSTDPVAAQAASAPEPTSRKVKRTLWFVLCLAAIVALYVLSQRSVWFQELPTAMSLLGRIAAVWVILGLFATLNPWPRAEGVRV